MLVLELFALEIPMPVILLPNAFMLEIFFLPQMVISKIMLLIVFII